MKAKIIIALFVIFFFIIITFPYIIAAEAAGTSGVFGGFLLNPIDGNTYLAKMRQGYTGAWLFTLPYTHEPGKPVFLFAFYLWLGHIARLLNLSLPIAYHAARVLAAGFYLASAYRFIRQMGTGGEDGTEGAAVASPERAITAVVLMSLGSGLGWAASLAGVMTADLWVAEAFPFLSAFTSPHFTLGMALLLWVLCHRQAHRSADFVIMAVGAIVLAIVMPFGAVAGGLVLALAALAEWRAGNRRAAGAAVVFLGFAGALILAQYWTILRDPLLAAWNRQNVTTSPPFWNMLLSYFPSLVFALAGIFRLYRSGRKQPLWLAVAWLVASFVLTAAPFPLQRRFMFGQFIPIALLAVYGLGCVVRRRFWAAFIGLLAISILTNLLLIVSSVAAVANQNPRLVMQMDERAALDWLDSHTPPGSLVLCAPGTGNFVPAYSHNRVIYGHPFETVDAERMEMIVTRFFNGKMSLEEQLILLTDYPVGWVFYGPRERLLGKPVALDQLKAVFQSEQVTIYQVIGSDG